MSNGGIIFNKDFKVKTDFRKKAAEKEKSKSNKSMNLIKKVRGNFNKSKVQKKNKKKNKENKDEGQLTYEDDEDEIENFPTEYDIETLKEFDSKMENMQTTNDKSDLYNFLEKDKQKNLDKISKLIELKENNIKFIETPLHIVIINTINTVEKVFKKIMKQKKFKLSYHDKIYLGVAFGFIALLLLIFKL